MKADKPYHHGDLRNALILQGMHMLQTTNIDDLSLRSLARDIGVGHNAPYRHFKNRRELLEAIASAGFRKLKAYNLRLELEYARDPETQLFESGMQLVKMAVEQGNLFKLMFGGYLSLSECGEELRCEAQESMQSLIRIIANGQQQDVFSKDDMVRQTLGAMSMVHGFSMMATSGMLQAIPKTDMELRAMALQVYEVLLNGLKKR
jgi:AcrR family transcriptional regulator